MALALAGEGAAMALVARDREALQKTAEEVWRTGSGAQVFQADVTSEEQVLRLARRCPISRASFPPSSTSTNCWARSPAPCETDRKSTRLNSSHLGISYAVFCLKK